MKKNFELLGLILIVGILLISCNQNNETKLNSQTNFESKFTELTGPYLRQKPPGMKAELFAPDLFSTEGDHGGITFSADGMEFSFTISTLIGQSLVEPTGAFEKLFMMYSHVENGHWTEPEEFSFTPARRSHYYLFFSPDGKKIYFNSFRYKTDPPDKSSSFIWYAERQTGDNWQWSEPKQIDFGKDYYNEYGLGGIYPSVASNGNLYFCHATDRPPSLFMSRYENGNYSLPEELDGALNEIDGAHPYIAPDESYIIFDNEDLFISFRDKNGLWMKPQNLGKSVNTVYDERRPFVSFDGKYLFFASNRINPELPNEPITLKKLQQLINLPTNGFRHLYWVDAKIIDEFRPDNFK